VAYGTGNRLDIRYIFRAHAIRCDFRRTLGGDINSHDRERMKQIAEMQKSLSFDRLF